MRGREVVGATPVLRPADLPVGRTTARRAPGEFTAPLRDRPAGENPRQATEAKVTPVSGSGGKAPMPNHPGTDLAGFNASDTTNSVPVPSGPLMAPSTQTGVTSGTAWVAHVHQAILDGVVHLQRQDAEHLSVVLKPDAHTEMTLHLQTQGDHIEAQVALQRGDHAAFSGQWPDLQAKLAHQGIRLSSLGTGESSTSNFSSPQGGNSAWSQHQSNWGRESTPAPGLRPAFRPVRTPAAPAGGPRGTASRQGWETWA